jgi:hypothetical protein
MIFWDGSGAGFAGAPPSKAPSPRPKAGFAISRIVSKQSVLVKIQNPPQARRRKDCGAHFLLCVLRALAVDLFFSNLKIKARSLTVNSVEQEIATHRQAN